MSGRTEIRVCRTVAGVPMVQRGRGFKGWLSLWLTSSRLFSSQFPYGVCVERH